MFYEKLSSGDKKILKWKRIRGNKMVQVKWLGYDNMHNSWLSKGGFGDVEMEDLNKKYEL